MPIRQQRLIDLISAFESAQHLRADLQLGVMGALEAFRNGHIGVEEMATQIKTAFAVTQIPTHHIVCAARERQHFKDMGRRNEYAANRRAAQRIGIRDTIRDRDLTRRMAQYAPEQLAVAQAIPQMGIPTADTIVEAPTAEQLAADDALMANADEDELATHRAGLNKGIQ